MLDKIPNHYALTAPGSIYDEEALTALELAGRTAAKVNEIVDAQNQLTEDTEAHLAAQDRAIPEKIAEEVQEKIDNGEFDAMVDKHIGNLEDRVDNLAGHVTGGSLTTMDAEVIDGRVDNLGTTRPNVGTSIRAQILDVFSYANASAIQGASDSINVAYSAGEAFLTFTRAAFDLRKGNETTIIETVDLTKTDTCAPIIEYFTNDENGRVVIRVPAHCQLVYSMRDKRIYIRQQNRLIYGDLLLIANAYGRIFDGILLKEMDAKARENIVKALEDVNTYSKKLNDRIRTLPYIGLSDRSRVTVTPAKDGTGSMLVKLPVNIQVLGSSNYTLTVSEDTVAEYTWTHYIKEITSAHVLFKVPANTVLALDFTGRKIGIHEARHLTADHVILLVNNWEMLSEGALLPFIHQTELDALEARTAALESAAPAVENQGNVDRFAALMNTGNRFDSFVFATDFHPVWAGRNWWQGVNEAVNHLARQFNKTAADFVVTGGDWLNNETTPAEACHALSNIYGKLRAAFGENVHLLLGNHDTNYQGTEILAQAAINNIWYKKTGAAYYTFDTVNARYFMFDSGLDWTPEIDAYKGAQVEWFIDGLKANSKPFMALGSHMIHVSEGVNSPFISEICAIADAFNRRTTYTYNGATHNFAAGVGSVKFLFGGHIHADRMGTLNGIPYFTTKNYNDGASFDFVHVDFDANKISLIREGTGGHRTLDITTNEPAPPVIEVGTWTIGNPNAITMPKPDNIGSIGTPGGLQENTMGILLDYKIGGTNFQAMAYCGDSTVYAVSNNYMYQGIKDAGSQLVIESDQNVTAEVLAWWLANFTKV